jgi:Protein of unknown function (DUF2442)
MNRLIKIHAVQPLDGHWLRLTFSDGAVKDVDVGEIIARGGVFAAIGGDRGIFERVRVNPDTQTIEWPGEVDLDPDVLYGRFEPDSGVKVTRRTIREATADARIACSLGAALCWSIEAAVPLVTSRAD